MKALCILVAVSAFAVRAYAATDSDVAKQCQTMAEQAHPRSLPDTPAVTNLRNSYFDLCRDRHGNMDPLLRGE